MSSTRQKLLLGISLLISFPTLSSSTLCTLSITEGNEIYAGNEIMNIWLNNLPQNYKVVKLSQKPKFELLVYKKCFYFHFNSADHAKNVCKTGYASYTLNKLNETGVASYLGSDSLYYDNKIFFGSFKKRDYSVKEAVRRVLKTLPACDVINY